MTLPERRNRRHRQNMSVFYSLVVTLILVLQFPSSSCSSSVAAADSIASVEEIVRLQSSHDDLKNQLQSLSRSIRSELESFQSQSREPPKIRPPTPHLELLLSVDSFYTYPADKLRELVDNAVGDLSSLSQEGIAYLDSVSWREKSRRSSEKTEHCDSSEESDASPNATKVYLEDIILLMKEAFQKRVNQYEHGKSGGSPLGPDATERVLEGIMFTIRKYDQKTKRDKLKKEEAKEKRHEVYNLSCIQKDDIQNLVKEGLESLHRKRDLRTSLSNILWDDKTASSVGDPTPVDLTALPLLASKPIYTKSLRYALDSPLFQKGFAMLDVLAESLGGYHQALDRVIDSLEDEEHPEGSIGRNFGNYLMTLLEKANPPQTDLTKTKAGFLKEGAMSSFSDKLASLTVLDDLVESPVWTDAANTFDHFSDVVKDTLF